MKILAQKLARRSRFAHRRKITNSTSVVNGVGEFLVRIESEKLRNPLKDNSRLGGYEIAGHLRNGAPILESSFDGTQFTPEELKSALNKIFRNRTYPSTNQAN